MKAPPVPEAFQTLMRGLHQDIFREGKTEEELVQALLRPLTADERRSVRRFLDELFAGNPDGGDFRRIWRKTVPDWFIKDAKGVRHLLELIRDRTE